MTKYYKNDGDAKEAKMWRGIGFGRFNRLARHEWYIPEALEYNGYKKDKEFTAGDGKITTHYVSKVLE